MAENDIYNSERRYYNFKENVEHFLEPPVPFERKRKYWIKNPQNLRYFKLLFQKLESRDTSFIRRMRICGAFLIVAHVLDKDIAQATREDMDQIMAFAHRAYVTVTSKQSFIKYIRFTWKMLFPELDERGRIDEYLIPYAVRHLSGKIDRSKEKLRGDKFSLVEFEQLVQSFADDPRMQAVLTVGLESLARPQELMYRKIKDVELHDNYGKIYITSHGKEGTGFLRVIDSYFYLSQWINKHPFNHDPDAYLFINIGKNNRYGQMTPFGANKLIRERCRKLGINKPITLYSLKRNGVTLMRLGGRSDLDIQHTARCPSTHNYADFSIHIFRVKVGLLKFSGRIITYNIC